MIRKMRGNPLYKLWRDQKLKPCLGRWDVPYPPSPFELDVHRYMLRLMAAMQARDKATSQYSWAVPSPEAITWIAERCPRIAEMGAGRGYWAALLDKAGVDIVAYDSRANGHASIKNGWHRRPGKEDDPTLWFPVQYGTPSVLAEHSDRTLLLCWPPIKGPPDGAMAGKCLAEYRGPELLFIGDRCCCGGPGFWRTIEKSWIEHENFAIPTWPGMRDYITIYRHKRRRSKT